MLARTLPSTSANLRRPLYPHYYSAVVTPPSDGRIPVDSSWNHTSLFQLSAGQCTWRCRPVSKGAIYAPPRLGLLVESTMNQFVKRFYLIVVFVFGCVTPVMANQPPGPGVSLPQILMLPLMALFTALCGT